MPENDFVKSKYLLEGDGYGMGYSEAYSEAYSEVYIEGYSEGGLDFYAASLSQTY